jgi:hypothetical protein
VAALANYSLHVAYMFLAETQSTAVFV